MTIFHIKTTDGASLELEHEAQDVETLIRSLISSQYIIGRSTKVLQGNQVGQSQRVALMLNHVATVQDAAGQAGSIRRTG